MKSSGLIHLTSIKAFLIALFISLLLTGVYYPKWKMKLTEATISWDIAGYYIYLPALFIYGDLKKLNFKKEVYAKYNPYAITYENFTHPNGNEVIKYSAGMAVMYTPYFLLAHVLASPLGYDADGYSLPYQFAISFGGLLMAFIGLYYLRRVLLLFFDDEIVAWVVISIGLGTNYLEYATMHSPMTHGHVFMLVSILIWTTIKYYRKPSSVLGLTLGILVGLATLIRPTEIIIITIPLLWNVASRSDLHHRWQFLKDRYRHILLAAVAVGLIGCIQIGYWLYVADDPFVYSYQEQGFKFFKPQILNGLFSYRKGWLIYTPIMFFGLIGFYHLYKKHRILFWSLFVYTVLHIYITLSWSVWWYGGGLGQRALIHAYPALVFGVASFLTWIFVYNKKLKIPVLAIFGLFITYNFWLTHQAHRGGLLETQAMTKKYFYKILGRFTVAEDAKKFLDTNEEFIGKITSKEVIYFENYDDTPESSLCNNMTPIQGLNSFCVLPKLDHSEKIRTSSSKIVRSWVRISGDFFTNNKEWNVWKMAQLTVEFINNNDVVKSRHIKIQRHIHGLSNVHLYFDTAVPKKEYNEMHVYITNEDSPQSLLMDNLKIEQLE